MNEDQNKIQLPKDWKWVKFGEACNIIMGQSPPSTSYNTNSIGLPFFQGKAEFTELYPIVEKWCDAPNKIAEPNDILLSVRAPVGTTNIANLKCCIGRGLAAIRYENYKYAFYFLRSRQQELDSKGTGTTFRAISGETIRETLFPLPPKPTQQAIVSKIEELFSELDKGIENLRTAQQQLKTYRQSVLESAFKGLFTVEWRREQSNKISSELIIKQVHSEKEKVAKKNGYKLPQVEIFDEEELSVLPKLPETWTWITPDEISSPEKYSIGIGPFGSNLKVSDYKSEGVPLVFVKNITRNNFTLDLKFITENKFKELVAHSIKPLDIVITKMGDPPGDCAIYPDNRPAAVITSDCLKFRVWDKFSNRKYFKYCIETNIIKKQLGLRTKGVAQKKISSSRFKTILFPFTQIEEQDEIVREIESRLSIADNMEESITQSLQQAEALRQSILKKAFEGRLT